MNENNNLSKTDFHKTYMKKSGKKAPSESQEQQRLVLKLRWFFPDLIFFAIPNGGLRNKSEAVRMKLEGVEKGTPDIFIAEPRNSFYGLFLELKKASGGEVSMEQKKKIKELREKGYQAEVCYGALDALEKIKKYLGIYN